MDNVGDHGDDSLAVTHPWASAHCLDLESMFIHQILVLSVEAESGCESLGIRVLDGLTTVDLRLS